MSSLPPSVFEQYTQIRRVVINQQVWFVAKDVATYLEYTNTRQAIRAHVDDSHKQQYSTLRQGADIQPLALEVHPQTMMINEYGLYALVLRSSKAEAKRFHNWVISELIPTIRRTGQYSITNRNVSSRNMDEKTIAFELRKLELQCQESNKQSEERMMKMRQEKNLAYLKVAMACKSSGDQRLRESCRQFISNNMTPNDTDEKKNQDTRSLGVIEILMQSNMNVPSKYYGSLGAFVCQQYRNYYRREPSRGGKTIANNGKIVIGVCLYEYETHKNIRQWIKCFIKEKQIGKQKQKNTISTYFKKQ